MANAPKMISRAGLLLAFLAGMVVTLVITRVVVTSNYEDCLLKGLQGGGKSDLAVEAVAGACRRKYPIQEKADAASRAAQIDSSRIEHNLDPFEVGYRLTGRAGSSLSGSFFSGELHNGFDSITVTAVRILLVTKSGHDSSSQEYFTKVRIPPLSTESFSFQMIPGGAGAEYTWNILGARGFVNR